VSFLDRQELRIAELNQQMRHFLEELISVYRDRTITTDQGNFNITLLEDFLACMANEMKTNTIA
jgi:hypothetical protein